MKLTADTITDEQIRELNQSAQKAIHMMWSATALGIQSESYPGQRVEARARCAEILNAREAEDDAAAETHEQDMIDASNNFDDGGVQ